jgi:3-dehydrosphinganine reductase
MKAMKMTAGHALVTGGSSGIGRELARKLAAAGYNVSLVARRTALLKEAAADVASHFASRGQRVFTYSADVSDEQQAEAAVKACIAELGAPELVITSAGIAVPGYFGDIPLEAFERSMAVNYFGSLYIVRAALPVMRARRSGRIVFISSGAGLMGLFGYSTYSPSKFALRGLAEALRAELGADNIGVSIAYPPDTETPMLEEENKIKPEETKVITRIVKTWSAEAVADCIMRGIARGAFGITPGAAITMMNRAPGITIPLLTWYSGWLVAGFRRKRAKHAKAA